MPGSSSILKVLPCIGAPYEIILSLFGAEVAGYERLTNSEKVAFSPEIKAYIALVAQFRDSLVALEDSLIAEITASLDGVVALSVEVRDKLKKDTVSSNIETVKKAEEISLKSVENVIGSKIKRLNVFLERAHALI